MGELNRFENDFSKISDKLTNNTKIILGITLNDGENLKQITFITDMS